jgi:predicted permease
VPNGQPDIETLELIYDRIVRERDRLRDARRAVTAQLGPLPAAAAVVLGLFAGLPDHVHNRGLVWAALAVFIGVILLSAWGIRVSPYRRLSAQLDAPTTQEGLREDDSLPRKDWLLERIRHERRIYYGDPAESSQPTQDGIKGRWRRFWREPQSLEESFGRERSTLLVVQTLLAVEVVLLALARLLP